MNSIPKRILIWSGAVLVLLLGLNLWLWPNQSLQMSPTSFGIMPYGYKAAFDLLSEMHFPVTRSYRRSKLTPTNATVWFVSPSFLDSDKPSAQDAAHEVVEWASRGGTAVIFGDPASDWTMLGLTREVEKGEKKDPDRTLIKGDLGPLPRWLETPDLHHFTAAKEKDAATHSHERVRMTADGKPFALEMAVGKHHGRIIAIADDNFLRNEHLADADASLVLVDLVRAFGAPVFDEHSHGLAPPASLTLAILESRAFLPLLHSSDEARIVNLSSVFGIIAPPGNTAYSASKFAVRGFSESLRHELRKTRIGVTVVHPGGVATSIVRSARMPKSNSPEEDEAKRKSFESFLTLPPAIAGETIVRGVENRKARVLVGTDAKVLALIERLMPVNYWNLLGRRLMK